MKPCKRSGDQRIMFGSFGVGVELTLGDESLRAIVDDILPPIRTPYEAPQVSGRFQLVAAGTDTYDVIVEGDPYAEHATLDVALDVLDAQMRMFIAANASEVIFVHAGTVAHEGRAIVIPGESFSGKTTLVRALVQAGATYYSDEYAVLDADGRVHPYPRRLSIRARNGEGPHEQHVSELGGVAGDSSADVGAILITRYQPGGEWGLERRSAGEGVLALMASTVPAQARPRQSLRALGRAAAGAAVLEGDRGEADEFAPRLLDQLSALAA